MKNSILLLAMAMTAAGASAQAGDMKVERMQAT